jgi:SAM-dependent methyltransferase
MRECDALLAAGEAARGDLLQWVNEHYGEAADAVIGLLADVGVSMTDRRVADIGCGDGLIDLGLVHRTRPSELVGYDIEPTDERQLLRAARTAGIAKELPPSLRFETAYDDRIPAEAASFDVAVSWSVFEHATDPVGLAREIRRVLSDDGCLFLQLWPFYSSEHGSHLWDWFPGEGFVQHRVDDAEIERTLRDRPGTLGSEWARTQVETYRTLNRLTLDGLQRSLMLAGFRVTRLELTSNTALIPFKAARHRLSDLMIGGVKLIARPT